MLNFHPQLKVFLATAACDLRMSFNGLWAAAQQQLGEDPKSGALFVFSNRRHTHPLLTPYVIGGTASPWSRTSLSQRRTLDAS